MDELNLQSLESKVSDLVNEPKEAEEVKEIEAKQEVQEDKPNIEEQYAREKGWRPKEEWDENKGEWIDAAEFNRRGPLFDTIGKLKDDIRDYKKSADALVEHNRKLAEQAKVAEQKGREKAVKELEEQRKAAVQDGDLEEFERIDKEIQEYNVSNEPNESDAPQIDPAITDWHSKNEWFEKDQAMTSYMIATQQNFINQGLSIREALDKSTEVVKQEFAHKFGNPNKNKPAAVGGQQDTGTKKTYSVNDLPAEYRPVFNAIARKTDMKISEYVEQLKELGVMS